MLGCKFQTTLFNVSLGVHGCSAQDETSAEEFNIPASHSSFSCCAGRPRFGTRAPTLAPPTCTPARSETVFPLTPYCLWLTAVSAVGPRCKSRRRMYPRFRCSGSVQNVGLHNIDGRGAGFSDDEISLSPPRHSYVLELGPRQQAYHAACSDDELALTSSDDAVGKRYHDCRRGNLSNPNIGDFKLIN